MSKVIYVWVRVGNGDPEPAAITGEKPNRKATTFGCPDTFDVDRENSGCSIVLAVNNAHRDHRPGGHDRYANLHGRAFEAVIKNPFDKDRHEPLHEVTAIDAGQREKDYRRETEYVPHSYAGFGRKGIPA